MPPIHLVHPLSYNPCVMPATSCTPLYLPYALYGMRLHTCHPHFTGSYRSLTQSLTRSSPGVLKEFTRSSQGVYEYRSARSVSLPKCTALGLYIILAITMTSQRRWTSYKDSSHTSPATDHNNP